MKNNYCRKGYLLVETICSLTVISILSLALITLLTISINYKNRINDKLEIQQQIVDTQKHIEMLISQCYGIASIKEYSNVPEENGYKKVYWIDIKNSDIKSENRVIYLNPGRKKIFVSSLDGGNPPSYPIGGYEIGDYITGIYFKSTNDNTLVNIKLTFQKNNETAESLFSIRIANKLI
ncbi:MAG: type II secretion system GspH family protein [Clostridioides sp.]|jgi:type II secretory pathway pseudopilin PulG|nr:type II secretion system GspH family protein [Clostridioides sp.]